MNRLQSHNPHQAGNPFMIDKIPHPPQCSRDPSDAIKRCLRVLLINQAHYRLFVFPRSSCPVIVTRPGKTYQRTLTVYGNAPVLLFNQTAFFRRGTFYIFFQPVQLYLQPTNLFVQFRFSFFTALCTFFPPAGKYARHFLQCLLLPFAYLIRMYPRLAGQFRYRTFSLNRLKCATRALNAASYHFRGVPVYSLLSSGIIPLLKGDFTPYSPVRFSGYSIIVAHHAQVVAVVELELECEVLI